MSFYDEEKADFVRAQIRRNHRMRSWALRDLYRLHRGLARGDVDAEAYRDCAMPEDIWRIVEPVAELLFKGCWVPKDQYLLILDALLEHAEEISRLLPEQELLDAMAAVDKSKEELE